MKKHVTNNRPDTDENATRLITSSPDSLYKLVEEIFHAAQQGEANQFVTVTTALAHHLYRGYAEFAPALLAHLSLHNERFGLAVNESLNSAILVCALCYRLGWQQQPACYLISAALTKQINDPEIVNLRFESTRLQDQDLHRWQTRAITNASRLQALGVKSRLWLRSSLQQSERIDGKGLPNRLAGHQLDSGGRILSWASHFSQQLCPRANRPGLRPRQILRYAVLKTPFAYDRELIRATAEIFSPVQPGALFRQHEEGPLLMVLGRQSRQEVLYTEIGGDDAALGQIPAGETWRRYATPTKGGRSLLRLYVSRYLKAMEQSLTLQDGQRPQQTSLHPPEQLAALQHELAQPEPSVARMASFIDDCEEMKQRLLVRASSSNRSRQKISNTRQALMLLGFRRIGYVLTNDMLLHRLSSRQTPASAWLRQVSDLFGELCCQLADASGVTEPEHARLIGSAYVSGLFIDHKVQELPTRPQLNGVTPSFWHPAALFGIKDVTRIHQLSLALAKQWKMPQGDIAAINAAPANARSAGNAQPDQGIADDHQASRLTALLRLSHALSHGIWSGEALAQTLQSEAVAPFANQLKLSREQLLTNVESALQRCRPHSPLPDLYRAG